jgi:DNA modification methylase
LEVSLLIFEGKEMETKILVGDVRSRLSELPDGSVQCVVTSPPYWGLRDYGTASWIGGDENCDHRVGCFEHKVSEKQLSNSASAGHQAHDVCPKCGAEREDSQIGLEQTPQEYVQQMVSVFREVWRVLADDGVLWLNIGDSYYNYRPGKGQSLPKQTVSSTKQDLPDDCPRRGNKIEGLKEKDLVGIPWRLAFALQDDGWYLRQDIIWAKPNPMPESVRDRCTKSHEYIFMLTKNARYYFNNDAIREPLAQTTITRDKSPRGRSQDGGGSAKSLAGYSYSKTLGNMQSNPQGRNKRDVWFVPTKPFKGAHFAVMPEAIVEPCVLASSRLGDTVLDPFTGSGTVAVVANKHGRSFVGTELNPEYAEIAKNRITQANGGLFNNILIL